MAKDYLAIPATSVPSEQCFFYMQEFNYRTSKAKEAMFFVF